MLLLWCLSMIRVFSYPLGKRSFHLFVDLKKSIVSVSGRLSPHNFEMFSISQLQACAFRCWFSNNSVQFFFARMLSKLICGRSWHFLLHSVILMIDLLFFLLEALWGCSRWTISFGQDHAIFLLIHLTGVLCSHSSSFILSSFASLFNLSDVWNPSYPLCHSFNSSEGSVLLISSSIFPSSQVHVLFPSMFNQSAVRILPLSSCCNRSGFEPYLVN